MHISNLIAFFDKHGGSVGTVIGLVALIATGDVRRVIFHLPFARYQKSNQIAAKSRVRLLRSIHGDLYRTFLVFARRIGLTVGFASFTALAAMLFIYINIRFRMVGQGLPDVRQIVTAVYVPASYFLLVTCSGGIRIMGLAMDLRHLDATLESLAKITGDPRDANMPPESIVE
jgi:hypothetical protein